jgi:Nucleotidyltransferase domain
MIPWNQWVHRLQIEEPSALAVLLFGSRAIGSEGPYSDVDLRVITACEPQVRDRIYFEEYGGRLVHFSIGSRPIFELIRLCQDPERWAWMKPTYTSAKVLWDSTGIVDVLNRIIEANTPKRYPYVEDLQYALETLVEYVTKVKNAHAAADYVRAAYFAQKVGEYAWRTCRACSESPRLMAGESQAFEDRLEIGKDIPGYVENIEVCLGLRPHSRTIDDILFASVRLAVGVVDWVHTVAPRVEISVSLLELLDSGKVRQYLMQGM